MQNHSSSALVNSHLSFRFGFGWPVQDPLISERDRRHPRLDAFDTPFRFDPEAPS